MLNSANRSEEVAWLSRILTIKLKSFHMFQRVPRALLCRIKLGGGKALSQTSQSQILILQSDMAAFPTQTPIPCLIPTTPHPLSAIMQFRILSRIS